MTDREIQTALLAYYRENLPRIPTENRSAALCFLEDNVMASGVCMCALHVFGKDVYSSDWTNEALVSGRSFWGAVPGGCATVGAMVDAVSLRIRILEKIIARYHD